MNQLKEFMKQHDIWLRLLAILLAFILWIIARDANNPYETYTLRNIPVTITGADELLSNTKLSVIEYTETINVTVYGQNNDVTNSYLPSRVSVTVDVSQITDGAGEYTLTPEINVSMNGVEGRGTTPSRVRVLVDEVTTASVPVRVDATGTPRTATAPARPSRLRPRRSRSRARPPSWKKWNTPMAPWM